jgi:hypothetical protein
MIFMALWHAYDPSAAIILFIPSFLSLIASRFFCPSNGLLVKAKMLPNKTRNKKVTVVIAGLHTQGQGVTMQLTDSL